MSSHLLLEPKVIPILLQLLLLLLLLLLLHMNIEREPSFTLS